LIDKFRNWLWRRNQRKQITNAAEWINIKLFELDPKGSGIMIFTYGTPDYMVSGRAAEHLAKKIKPVLKERYPNYTFLFLPFFVNVQEEEKDE